MFYSGSNGELLIDGVKAAKVRSWSFTSSLGLLDTTSLEDTDTTVVPGVRTTTGSCQLFYYADDPFDTSKNSCSVLIRKLLQAGSGGIAPEAQQVTLRLKIADGTTAGKFVEGPAYLTSVAMACAVGEVLSADVAFQFNGALTGVAL